MKDGEVSCIFLCESKVCGHPRHKSFLQKILGSKCLAFKKECEFQIEHIDVKSICPKRKKK